jgi:hypothetical protein
VSSSILPALPTTPDSTCSGSASTTAPTSPSPHRPPRSPPIAQATASIRLTSTVTVLSTADPVKVFEHFVAVDLISGGRAEITGGRGAYTESFPLFGFDVADYDLFDGSRPKPVSFC